MFAGTHEFVLLAQPDDTTTVLQTERFTGLLPALLFNTALKARAEALPAD